MSDNVILLNSDKEILRGEKDKSDYKDFSNRKAQIRTRVKNRSDILAEEIKLLQESDEGDVADEVVRGLLESKDLRSTTAISERVKKIEQELDEIERRCDDIPFIRNQLHEVRSELGLETS